MPRSVIHQNGTYPAAPRYKVDAIGCVADGGIRVGLAAHFTGVLPIRISVGFASTVRSRHPPERPQPK